MIVFWPRSRVWPSGGTGEELRHVAGSLHSCFFWPTVGVISSCFYRSNGHFGFCRLGARFGLLVAAFVGFQKSRMKYVIFLVSRVVQGRGARMLSNVRGRGPSSAARNMARFVEVVI